jgi:hypothetical protein
VKTVATSEFEVLLFWLKRLPVVCLNFGLLVTDATVCWMVRGCDGWLAAGRGGRGNRTCRRSGSLA